MKHVFVWMVSNEDSFWHRQRGKGKKQLTAFCIIVSHQRKGLFIRNVCVCMYGMDDVQLILAEKVYWINRSLSNFFFSKKQFYNWDSLILNGIHLIQNDHHLSILLFSCKLALVSSFLNSKFKRQFSVKQGDKAYFASK